MKKIMFNDQYRLTKAVFDFRKTQTRRIINPHKGLITFNSSSARLSDQYIKEHLQSLYNKGYISARYHIGEIVAIAQRYCDIANIVPSSFSRLQGWKNKMFVKPYLMPRHIKITNIRLDCLQNITESDCLKEGIRREIKDGRIGDSFWCYGLDRSHYRTAQDAYAELIDKISGKGTWDRNPFVIVYDFQLID